MALNSRTYIRVPPDSTGKRSGTSFTLNLSYTTRTAPISVGDVITGVSSNTQGTVLRVLEESAATSGVLVLLMEGDYVNDSFTNGETLNVGGSGVATANGTGDIIHYQENVIVGANNPTNKQFVNDDGAAVVSFSEGAPQFSSFGALNVNQTKNVITYDHVEYSDPKLSLITSSIGGTGSYQETNSAELLSVDNVSGSLSRYRSNIWHRYDPGKPFGALMTLVTGDSGKAGLIRRWGLFDEEDGVFFEQSGSEGLFIVQRSSVGGTVTETKVPQSSWNGDHLDGTGGADNVSRVNLDTTKGNVYFIDLQWLGVGRVRYGIVADDRRILAHAIQNANQNANVYMKKANLPLTFEQVNVTSTAGTSEMKAICATVQSSNTYNPDHTHFSGQFVGLGFTGSFTEFRPLFSVRSKITGSNGLDNRSYTKPHKLSLYSFHHDVMMSSYKGLNLTGSSWISGDSTLNDVEFDFSATGFDRGRILHTEIIPAGKKVDIMLDYVCDNPQNWISRLADINAEPEAVTVALKLLPSATANTGSEATGSIAVTFDYNTYGD